MPRAKKSAAQSEDKDMKMLRYKRWAIMASSWVLIGAAFYVYAGWGMAQNIHEQLGVFVKDYSTAINVMRVSFFLAVFAAWLMSKLQDHAYFPILFRKKMESLDERQANVRRKVLEKSYRALAIILLVVTYMVIGGDGTLTLNFYDNNIGYPFAMALVAFLSLPSLVATWEKDA